VQKEQGWDFLARAKTQEFLCKCRKMEGKKGRGRKIFSQSRKIRKKSKWEETSFLKNAGLLQ
jgi:hypothetical protein